jgi:type IV pilus assembly protein PilE
MNMQKGFTLLELMIVVVVVGILAAIAVPSYQSYAIKTRRATAAACLTELSQFMERFYTVNLRYDQDTTGTAVALPGTQCQSNLTGHYSFAFLKPPTQRAYVIQAVPQGVQATKDPQNCGTLSLNQTGTRTAGGNPSECWK